MPSEPSSSPRSDGEPFGHCPDCGHVFVTCIPRLCPACGFPMMTQAEWDESERVPMPRMTDDDWQEFDRRFNGG